ncbi:uncharacterized protein BJX67DRAFT_361245 [Aspergillus lucknowensis]|uniref:Uncharacterized protein n=1 Tax=Aspergillus lucknowensis TaxID=176173 RepID=A0ABR4LK29_9EURO
MDELLNPGCLLAASLYDSPRPPSTFEMRRVGIMAQRAATNISLPPKAPTASSNR